MTAITFIIVLTASVVILALAVVAVRLHLAKRREQDRLSTAFDRARTVAKSGGGMQGTPYNVYGESAWSDDSRHQ